MRAAGVSTRAAASHTPSRRKRSHHQRTVCQGGKSLGSALTGASWFGQNLEYSSPSNTGSHGIDRGAGNIGLLVRDTCDANFDHC